MAMKIEFNIARIQTKITQHGERAERGMSDVMRKRARLIRDLARSYAPHKSGVLERNIDYVTIKDSNRRNSFEVYIDTDASRQSGRGTIEDYAKLMERRLRPYGNGHFELGEGSREKRLRTGKPVGGRFFQRATIEGTKLLREELQAAARGKSFPSITRETITRPFSRSVQAQNRARNVKRKNRKT